MVEALVKVLVAQMGSNIAVDSGRGGSSSRDCRIVLVALKQIARIVDFTFFSFFSFELTVSKLFCPKCTYIEHNELSHKCFHECNS